MFEIAALIPSVYRVAQTSWTSSGMAVVITYSRGIENAFHVNAIPDPGQHRRCPVWLNIACSESENLEFTTEFSQEYAIESSVITVLANMSVLQNCWLIQ
ncbi:hypothetical protein CEXT_679571 [Caerostris extrusa]|uniref:Uncharacterized protein n=1 Tax=Caerostris extrusa TaxID=172846 RepID=A0AAV4XSD6_CAEEX|nr:hypothetical protein CEXT_679571 [Caerostris extrusa]